MPLLSFYIRSTFNAFSNGEVEFKARTEARIGRNGTAYRPTFQQE